MLMRLTTMILSAMIILSVMFPLPLFGDPVLMLPNRMETLENGLRIYLVKYPSPNAVAYQIPVRVGSRNEVEKGKTGFAHFFEHLMFRGTKKRTGKEFSDIYTRCGAENNAWTWFDITNYHGTVSKAFLPTILEVEADRFMNLYFDEKMLKDEAGAVLGEYNKNIAQPENVIEELLLATAFKTHPYAHTTMGYKEDILKFTERYADVWPFFQNYYRPSNTSIVLVGDIDFDRALTLIKKQFGNWKNPSNSDVKIPEEPEQTEPRKNEAVLDKTVQTRIHIAYKIPAFSTKTKDFAALALLSELEFSQVSEFQKTYRYDKKWVDSVNAAPLATIDPGLWTIELRLTDSADDAQLLSATDRVIAKLGNEIVQATRLDDAKKRFRSLNIANWFSTSERLSSRIAWFTSFEPDLGVLDRIFDQIRDTSPEDIKRFAATNLIDARKTTVILRGKKP